MPLPTTRRGRYLYRQNRYRRRREREHKRRPRGAIVWKTFGYYHNHGGKVGAYPHGPKQLWYSTFNGEIYHHNPGFPFPAPWHVFVTATGRRRVLTVRMFNVVTPNTAFASHQQDAIANIHRRRCFARRHKVGRMNGFERQSWWAWLNFQHSGFYPEWDPQRRLPREF